MRDEHGQTSDNPLSAGRQVHRATVLVGRIRLLIMFGVDGVLILTVTGATQNTFSRPEIGGPAEPAAGMPRLHPGHKDLN